MTWVGRFGFYLYAKSGLSSENKSNRLTWTLQFWGFLEGGLRWFAWRRWRACYFFNHPLSLEQFSDQTLFSEGYFVLGRVGALGPQQAAKSPPKNRDLRHAMYQAAWTIPWGEDLLSMVEMSLFLNPVGKCAASWGVVSSVSFFVRYPRTGQSVLRIDEVCCYTEARRVWNFQANLTLLYIIYSFFVTRLGVRWHLEKPYTLNQLRSSRQPSSEILQSEINRNQQNWLRLCFFFGDLRFCDANTVNGGAVVVRADMSIYKCMAYFLHFEGAHTEQYLNCVDGTLERKTRLTGSRCSDALNFLLAKGWFFPWDSGTKRGFSVVCSPQLPHPRP